MTHNHESHSNLAAAVCRGVAVASPTALRDLERVFSQSLNIGATLSLVPSLSLIMDMSGYMVPLVLNFEPSTYLERLGNLPKTQEKQGGLLVQPDFDPWQSHIVILKLLAKKGPSPCLMSSRKY